jgi:hypothetical protein
MSDYFGVYILITGFVIIVFACVENIKYIKSLDTSYLQLVATQESEKEDYEISDYKSDSDNDFNYDDFAAQNHMMYG